MIDGETRVEFEDVEVLDGSGLVLRCRVGDTIIWVPPLRDSLRNRDSSYGRPGRLVLPHDLAIELGLA